MRFDRDLRRKVVHYVMAGLALVCVGLALAPLVYILYTSVSLGSRVVSLAFLTGTEPLPCTSAAFSACPHGGIGPAIQGTLLLIGIASSISLPLGILTGIYLSEYGRGAFGSAVRFVADVMTGIPSIVVGIFVYSLFLYAGMVGWLPVSWVFSTLSGGVALSVIMVPIVARTSEEALRTVPVSTREAALALGIPPHRTVGRIVLATGRTAILTGALLAIARAGGETAPLLATDFGSRLWFQGIGNPSDSLPISIWNGGLSGYPNLEADAWGATLILIVIMLTISVTARLLLRQRFGAGVV
ncbi:MAG TPA: phosphate ABC transporter permease PstA [Thermoplasmata archaeon]|nr:phosphate ABC transporter permease PstA [Thermoplasmata archaeon]